MNIAFILVIAIVIAAVVFMGFQGYKNILQVNDSKNKYVLDLNFISCYPDNDIENLPQLSNQCCVINGGKTTQRPFTIPNVNLPVIVDTVPIPYEQACIGFCKNIDTSSGNCLDSTSGNNISTYGICVNTLKPAMGCSLSSLPVARDGQTPYYAVNVQQTATNTINNCSITSTC